MANCYSAEKQILILIALLKAHGIRHVIASPGNTNVSFVASLQYDSYFKIYSCVDERSAAYMACGMAAELNEPVVLSCTGATASRNYYPGLTEAYYRKLPVLAVTSSQVDANVGQLSPQATNRQEAPSDVVRFSANVSPVLNDTDFRNCELTINNAILELKRHGGGPVHINLQQRYLQDFSVRELPTVNVLQRYSIDDKLPELPKGEVAIFIGSHKKMSKRLTEAIDSFCTRNNAVVLHDITSSYKGQYGVNAGVRCFTGNKVEVECLIDIGEVSAYSYTAVQAKEVWRVSEDGEFRNRAYYKNMTRVFEMPEDIFFESYSVMGTGGSSYNNALLKALRNENDILRSKIPNLPLSYWYIAQKTTPLFPCGAVVHLAILSSLRAWKFFDFPDGVEGFSNVGGFGIDGCLSTCVGSSIVEPGKLHFCITGDLAFFYDMNILGTRHLNNNIRVLLINNNQGMEMVYPNHYPIVSHLSDPHSFNAAQGHYSIKDKDMVKSWATSCGFEYLRAESCEEFDSVLPYFMQPEIGNRPVIFEVFTTEENESLAYSQIIKANVSASDNLKSTARHLLGEKGIALAKRIIKKES